MAHGCGTGGSWPNPDELGSFRTALVALRLAADSAAREARNNGQINTGRELGNLATIATTANAASYQPHFSCSEIASRKSDIQAALQRVYDAAALEGMTQADQDRILGPVHDAAEDVFASGGVPLVP
jgi:hypothetical protein